MTESNARAAGLIAWSLGLGTVGVPLLVWGILASPLRELDDHTPTLALVLGLALVLVAAVTGILGVYRVVAHVDRWAESRL